MAYQYTLRQRSQLAVRDKYGYPTGQWYWSPWSWLCFVKPGKMADSLQYWRELNDYAISARGESARREFAVVEGLPFEG